MKALLWKEWKESWLNFLFSILVLFILKTLNWYIQHEYPAFEELGGNREGFMLVTFLFISVYGLITGIGMFAMEYTTRTIPYLLTRPISRINIVSSKWLVGMGEILVLGVIAWVLAGKVEPHEIVIWNNLPLSSFPVYLIMTLLFPVFFYFLAVLSSLILRDTTRSTVLAFILVILVIAVRVSIADHVHYLPDYAVLMGLVELLFATLLLVLVSTIIFLRQQS